MAKAGLIFTTDYEIFGNGSGCVKNCMIEPTRRMAETLEEYGARLVVFVDLCEYWAFEKEYAAGKLKEDWAGLIKIQLQDLIRRGHDVQLHFHPQWLDYKFDGKSWILNYDLWRIGQLKYEDTVFPERGLKDLFKRGKADLESMLRPIKEDYRCHVFRAGAWSMQPEGMVLKAMKESGFDIDSTVAPGLSFADDFTYFNFIKSPERFTWTIKDSLLEVDPNGEINEIPIFTTTMSLWSRFKFLAIKKKKNLAMKPTGCIGSSIATTGKGKVRKILELLSERKRMFTFGDASSAEEMIYFTRSGIEKAKKVSDTIPIVAISHPKTFANDGEVRQFLKWCTQQDELEFSLYEDFNY